ncbi:alpha/beta hydrolase [Roseibium sp.]|uniref:alpha/beta hydrolase n=1 Tax=Roseibium sp. TaxID=1936156 RepID=UPI003D104C13
MVSGNRLAAVKICLVLAALLTGLTACSSRPDEGALALNTEPVEGASNHDILIVTTRERDERPGTYFNGERAQEVNYAEVRISVPPAHVAGAIEWPSSLPGNPATDFVTRNAAYLPSETAFKARLNEELRKRPHGKRGAFLFIHGYNTLFAEGLYRFTQFVHDAEQSSVPVLFTWASRGKLKDYLYDLNSAAIARDALERTLTDLANSNAETISVLAHSMGNYLLMETIRQAPPKVRQKINRKIRVVVLAAPDIDIDLFKANLRRLGKPQKPFVVVLSRDDRALRLSRALSGGVERVGAFSNDEELASLGAVVIDVTDLEADDSAHHSKFAALAEFSPELQRALGNRSLTSVASIDGPRDLGSDLGSFVGNTAQTAVTLPIKIITAPITLATGGY